MKLFLSFAVTLAPLVIGLVSWSCAAVPVFWGRVIKQKTNTVLSLLSWFSCACSLWFPIYTIHRWVENEDIIAILDCAGAYMLCASVLLCVTFLLNLLSWILNRRK